MFVDSLFTKVNAFQRDAASDLPKNIILKCIEYTKPNILTESDLDMDFLQPQNVVLVVPKEFHQPFVLRVLGYGPLTQ